MLRRCLRLVFWVTIGLLLGPLVISFLPIWHVWMVYQYEKVGWSLSLWGALEALLTDGGNYPSYSFFPLAVRFDGQNYLLACVAIGTGAVGGVLMPIVRSRLLLLFSAGVGALLGALVTSSNTVCKVTVFYAWEGLGYRLSLWEWLEFVFTGGVKGHKGWPLHFEDTDLVQTGISFGIGAACGALIYHLLSVKKVRISTFFDV